MPKFAEASIRNAQIHADIKNQRVVFSYPDAKNNEPYIHSYALLLNFSFIFNVSFAVFFLVEGWYWLAATLILPAMALTGYFLFFTDTIKHFFPKMNAALGRIFIGHYFYVDFAATDEKNECVIPAFKNMYLNYEAHGDFGRQLKTIDIVPIIYNQRKTHQVFGVGEKTVYAWKATFKFSRKPKDGFMLVEYL